MNSFNDIFELMKKNLDVSDTARRLWIEPIKPVKLNNNKVVLYIADSYVKKIVEENYSDTFKKSFKEILGFDVELEFLTDENPAPSPPKDPMLNLSEPIPELQDDDNIVKKLHDSEINSTYQHTFDTFIVGDSNRLACAACKAIAQGQARNYNPLYIYSDPGLGKTHLLCAVRNEAEMLHPEANIVMVSAETFVTEFINSVRSGQTEEFKKKYRTADMFLIDDVQFFSGKKESQNELFHTFNELHTAGKQIILTSDRPPKEINDIEERLLTRFEWGLLADIAPPEFETRLAIIKRKAELLNLKLSNNVMEYMADKLKNNIRQIEGAILKMNAMAMLTETSPTLNMAQNIIRDVMTEQQPVPITVEKVISEVSHIFNVSPEELRSQNRNSQISTARQVAIYVISRVTGLSYTSIGKEFGGRDHSTIVYATNKVKRVMKKDPAYRATVEDLIKNIGNM